MPKFNYIAKNAQGAPQHGELEGSSESEIAAELLARKLIPVSIDEITTSTSFFTQLPQLFAKDKISLDDMSLFCRQMGVLIKAGVPIIGALQRLAETTTSPPLSQVLYKVVQDISGGQTLTLSLAKYPNSFRGVVVSVVDAGENSGRLDLAFDELSKYFMLEALTIQRIKQATRYPLIVLTAILLAIIIINFMVVPAFTKLFAQFHQDLPLPTRILIGFSSFMVNNWQMLLAGCVGIFFAFRSFLETTAGRYQWDHFLLNLPIIGPLITRIILGRFSRVFAMVLEAGVPLVQGLGLAANALGNTYMQRSIVGMKEGIERGESLTRSAAQTDLFTPLVLQMLVVGEETGQIDSMLKSVAEFYEQEVEYDLSRLASLIEPIILVVLGFMVGILALGVFLPMWNMVNFVRQ